MTNTVTVTSPEAKADLLLAEMIFGSGNEPSFTGKFLAVNPTVEQFRTLDPIFNVIMDERASEGLTVMTGVVYYDTGAGRAFILPEDTVEIN